MYCVGTAEWYSLTPTHRSRIGYSIQVDANENPTDDVTSGIIFNNNPAATESINRTSRIISALFQQRPC